MIITVKLRLRSISDTIVDFQRQYNNVVRWAYNRSMEDRSRNEIFTMIKNNALNHVDKLDVTWKREAAKLGISMADSSKETDNKCIFQSKAFKRRKNGKTTRDEFLKEKEASLVYISCEGSKADLNGNRKFKFYPETLSGSVKLDGRTVYFECYPTNKGQLRLINEAYGLAEHHKAGITYRLNQMYLYICVDLADVNKENYNKIHGRTLALDLNPSYIGLSIVNEKDCIILKKVYDLSNLSKRKNKHRHELTEIACDISRMCKHYGVSLVGFEKLKMKSCDKGKGKRFNKQVNNEWRREYFLNSLKKHLELINCPYREIVASYSSFIGCMCYPNDTDSVAASIELNRRLRLILKIYIEKSLPKGDIIYPKVDLSLLNRRKEEAEVSGEVSNWKGLYEMFKRAGHSYRCLYPVWVRKNGFKEMRFNSSTHSGVTTVCVRCNKKLYFN